MMQLEPSRRISVKGALAHPFFAELNNQMVNYSPSFSGSSSSEEDEEMSERHGTIDLR